ncbi:ABC transporter ATP-binding protein [Lentilactobacillus fungorum]|uniref:ABC transporter ATP-binding protein n=1 Tax=Lentilactobacillus fungorum TaxID=2201250 RepID=A0ABQ3VYZ1_9LACO|nr:ABC transporter ATP-binding protein [Lentilactobacillus fungorum]GHP13613.1 ABC transporter ATP-binding protein [Lentilactobacillus fungorum]
MVTSLSTYSISKNYKHGRINANKNITVDFSPGEITALTGHNGAGKTTLLKQIMGVVKPDSGSITYRGISFIRESNKARELIAMMPQFHAPLVGVTLRQAIEAVGKIRGISHLEMNESIDQIAHDLKIEKWLNIPGQKLSGGLQRLTSFAMTVVAPPPILLFDEPTNDVDPVRRIIVWEYLRKLANNDHIIVVVTHNLFEVERYADRYILLNEGKVTQDEHTSILRKELLSSSLLSITSNKPLDEAKIPDNLNTNIKDGALEYSIHLTNDQIPKAIEWLLQGIKSNKITHYSLSPFPLDMLYRGLTDG